jgi:hypothetical protein
LLLLKPPQPRFTSWPNNWKSGSAPCTSLLHALVDLQFNSPSPGPATSPLEPIWAQARRCPWRTRHPTAADRPWLPRQGSPVPSALFKVPPPPSRALAAPPRRPAAHAIATQPPMEPSAAARRRQFAANEAPPDEADPTTSFLVSRRSRHAPSRRRISTGTPPPHEA